MMYFSCGWRVLAWAKMWYWDRLGWGDSGGWGSLVFGMRGDGDCLLSRRVFVFGDDGFGILAFYKIGIGFGRDEGYLFLHWFVWLRQGIVRDGADGYWFLGWFAFYKIDIRFGAMRFFFWHWLWLTARGDRINLNKTLLYFVTFWTVCSLNIANSSITQIVISATYYQRIKNNSLLVSQV